MLRDITRTRRVPDYAIDLGTSSTQIASRSGVVQVDEPSVVAFQQGARGREVVAVGEEARRMLGRTPPGITVIQPIRNGVVTDFHAAETLLHILMKRSVSRSLTRPKVAVCAATDLPEAERRAIVESVRSAGAKEVMVIPNAMATALGVDLPVKEAAGSMVIDIGGGRTEVAVISLGGMVVRKSIPVAGDALESAISHWLMRHHQLTIGERTAEKLKIRIAAALPVARPQALRIRGRDVNTGAPRELSLNSNDMATALAPPLKKIQSLVIDVLSHTPPELSADIIDRGIILSGGSSLLPGISQILRTTTGLPILEVENPTRSTVLGAVRLMEDVDLFHRVTATG